MENKSIVICIDDSAIIQSALIKYLNMILPKFIEVKFFNNYLETIEFIKNNFNNIDIRFILCDHFVPLMNGFEFIAWLINNKFKIPIVVITGSADSDLIQSYKNLELVQFVLTKPVSRNTLKEKLLTLL